MNTLKAKANIECNTCGCNLPRIKSIKVEATTIEQARIEAAAKVQAWRASLTGQNCKFCASIIRDLAA